MDAQQQQQHHRSSREKVGRSNREESKLLKEEESPPAKQKQQHQATGFPASPPSASSSPSHEFSFTVSLVPDHNKAKAPPPNSFAIDLSPADDIFFHGHLLPLHLISHLPVSPRSSTNSLDSFTLPTRDLIDDHQKQTKTDTSTGTSNSSGNSNSNSNGINNNSTKSNHLGKNNNTETTKDRTTKPKSFSLFNWRKGCEVPGKEDPEKHKRKLMLDISHALKRYVRMVRPLLTFKGRRDNNLQFHRQSYSFSAGNLSWRSNKRELRGRRGEFSAPASMRTSPTNSGLLVATATLPSNTSDSTMEELQAAIQAAIAHCKNSIAAEEKIKC